MSLNLIHREFLKTDGVDWNPKSLTSGNAVYSDSLKVVYSHGYAGLVIVLSGGSDDIDINMEVSYNEVDWFIPYNSSGDSLGKVITDGTCLYSTRPNWWIVFTPQLASYLRFQFDPDADSTVKVVYLHRETAG